MKIKETIEEQEEFARNMEWMIITRIILYGLALIIAAIRTFDGVSLSLDFLCLISLLIFILNFICFFLAKKRLYLHTSTYVLLIIDILFVTWAVHLQGGLASVIFPINYLIIILAVSILVSLRAGIIITTLVSIAVILLFTLEYLNILPPVPIKGIGLVLYQEKNYVIAVIAARVIFFYAIAIISGYSSDKIKRQAREIRKKEKQLIHAEQMKMAARIAGETAHEVKNPLAVIKAGLYYLERILPEDNDKVRQTILQMDKATQRATIYFNDLLYFFRPPQLIQGKTGINEMIKKALDELPAEMLSNIEVKQELSSNLPDILADFDQLKQVIISLVKNASEAMAGVKGEKASLQLKSEKQGEFIKISVSDTGKGIPEKDIEHIFDPFFTTKGKGTGLGLAICQQIIDAHQGRIEVESQVGEGTTFVVKLPIGGLSSRQ